MLGYCVRGGLMLLSVRLLGKIYCYYGWWVLYLWFDWVNLSVWSNGLLMLNWN